MVAKLQKIQKCKLQNNLAINASYKPIELHQVYLNYLFFLRFEVFEINKHQKFHLSVVTVNCLWFSLYVANLGACSQYKGEITRKQWEEREREICPLKDYLFYLFTNDRGRLSPLTNMSWMELIKAVLHRCSFILFYFLTLYFLSFGRINLS